jgi:hypothetical protein
MDWGDAAELKGMKPNRGGRGAHLDVACIESERSNTLTRENLTAGSKW